MSIRVKCQWRLSGGLPTLCALQPPYLANAILFVARCMSCCIFIPGEASINRTGSVSQRAVDNLRDGRILDRKNRARDKRYHAEIAVTQQKETFTTAAVAIRAIKS